MPPFGSSIGRPGQIARRSLGLSIGLWLLLILTGCAASWSSSSSPESEPLPKLRDVRAAGIPAGSLPPPPSPVAKAMRLEVYRLEIAADANLLPLTQLAKRGTIAMPVRDLWRANGFLLGVLGPKELGELQSMELPILARGQATISAGRSWNVLSVYPPPPPPLTPPLSPSSSAESSAKPSIAQTTQTPTFLSQANASGQRPTTGGPVMELLGADGRSRPVTLTAGRRQFLFSLVPSGFQAGVLTLVPHLHQPEISLTPRLPSDVELDGRRFDELAMSVYLPAGYRLLLMPDASALSADRLSLADHLPQATSTDPAESSSGPEPTSDIVADRMGRLWLTGQVQGRQSQAVLLIRPLAAAAH